jgi:transcription initiation factor TFIIE subunit beta
MQSDNSRHLNTFILKILEFLKKSDKALSYREIEEKTGISILSNVNLVRALKSNVKIELLQNSIRFIPSFIIRSVEDLIGVLKETKGKGGIEMNKLSDSPFDITGFVKTLVDSNQMIILKDIDNSEIAFYNEMNCPKIKPEIKELWVSIKIPNHHDIVEQLNIAGLKNSEEQTFKKKKISKQAKGKRSKRKIAITNTHVVGLDLNNMEDSD